MQTKIVSALAAAILSGALLTGCTYDDDDDYRYNDPTLDQDARVPRTSREAEDAKLDTEGSRPYSPIKGTTTGDGMRRDMRTGGAITGSDVTGRERLEGNRTTPTPAETDNSSIPTRPGAGSGGAGPTPGINPGSGGGTSGTGVGTDAPASGLAPGN